MQNALTFWDRVAPRYAKSPIRDLGAYERTLARVRAYLHANDRVLELGCGTGTTALKLAPQVGEYVATDLAPGMIEIAQDKAKSSGPANLRFMTADIFEVAPVGAKYDVVCGFNLFHLMKDPDAAFARVADLVRPGGLFISKTVCRPEARLPLLLRSMLWLLPLAQALGKAPYVNFMRTCDLEERIARADFTILETGDYPAMPPSRFIVARKM